MIPDPHGETATGIGETGRRPPLAYHRGDSGILQVAGIAFARDGRRFALG